MVQKKQPKSKPKKHHAHAKKKGKQTDISDFRAQLDVLGLKIIQVTSDGNCFFRALADQLDGNEEEHEKYRNMVVQYIMKNRDMFEPFIEDEVPFEKYCESMQKDGTWAGNMELQAASLVTRTNACIHRHMSPRWYIQNFDIHGAKMIHLSYHDGEHYNSVRMKEDPCTGPAKPVSIKADDNLKASSQAANCSGAPSKSETSKQNEVVKMVMAGSNCYDAEKVEQVLQLVDGDANAAVEFLIAESDSGETSEQNVLFDYDFYDEDYDSRDSDKLKDKGASANGISESVDGKKVAGSRTSSVVDKKIPRNKVCPCGSKKKNKACCRATAGKPSSKILVEQVDPRGKRGKQGKQGKKAALATKAASTTSNMSMPDLGALCI